MLPRSFHVRTYLTTTGVEILYLATNGGRHLNLDENREMMPQSRTESGGWISPRVMSQRKNIASHAADTQWRPSIG